MNKKQINDFVSGKLELNNNGSEMNDMIKLFPYCETIRKIDAIIKYKNEDISFEEILPTVAIYSSNRKSFFLKLIKNSDPFLFKKITEAKQINYQNTKKPFLNWLSNDLKFDEKNTATKNTESSNIISNENTDDLMTETLAKLYFEQGHFEQAIRAYKILCLKYPKKSSLFATEIKKLTKLK